MAKPGDQGELIIVSDSVDEMQPIELQSGLVNNRIEQKLYLINALADLSGARMREGFEVVGETADVQARYGEHTATVVEGARRIRAQLLESAEDNFKKASKFHETTAAQKAGSWVVDKVHKHPYFLHRVMYSGFLKDFYLGQDFRTRAGYRAQLLADISQMRSWSQVEHEVTEFNREHNLRPHQPTSEPIPAEATTTERRTLNTLESRERLLAILYDPRAGFFPATHREKNQALTFLDYLDNPAYPAGTVDQLIEVYVHAKRRLTPEEESTKKFKAKDDEAIRTIESLIWETGDYLADAAQAFRLLSELKTATGKVSPHVTLAEELGSEHPAIPYLVQYDDQETFIEEGGVPRLRRNPWRTAEERWVPKAHALAPGKHKTVHSQYARPDRTPAFQKHIDRRAHELTFGEARDIVEPAIESALRRAYFQWQRMHDVTRFTDYQKTPAYVDAVTACLASVKDEPVVQLLVNGHLEQAA